MTRLRSLVVAGTCAALSTIARAPAVSAADSGNLRVCLVSGSIEYKSNETLPEFQKYLEANYAARCTRAFIEGSDTEHLNGLEQLADCDVMLLFTKRLKLSGEQLERIKSYCLAGKPIVGVRTASHAVQTWLDLDKEVLGGNYQGHYGAGPVTVIKIADGARDNPLLAGFKPFDSAGSLYKNHGLSSDADILLTGNNGEQTEPIAWTRHYKGARIFYTSLGHPQDFSEESFRRLLANALFWTAGRAIPAR